VFYSTLYLLTCECVRPAKSRRKENNDDVNVPRGRSNLVPIFRSTSPDIGEKLTNITHIQRTQRSPDHAPSAGEGASGGSSADCNY